ncbi:ATP-binding protein [Pseudonocardia sp. ICBG1293]|uniref:ATP-binding protein n=1 Tax=Pseudonocardia sp. ICBG1293 TaxID=2844382 RepID=UPI001CCAD44F|nr:ATP-binding protein [Pseudonocardia sp. ICBG1293]
MPPPLRVELPVEPGSAGRSRRETGRWLASLCGTDQQCPTVQDLVLAVNEAVSNSIEHAYGATTSDDAPTVVLRGEAEGHRVRMEVSDRGLWRDPPADPGHRGRGIGMIEAVAEDVRVEPGPDGTRVSFEGRIGRCPGLCVPAS